MATVLIGNMNKNIFGLEIKVGKEIKSTSSTMEIFLRVMHCNKNICSICDWTNSGE